MMKRYLYMVLVLMIGLTLTVSAAEHARKQPAPKKDVAQKVVDPKQIAEDARFEGADKSARKALLELDAMDPKLVDTWVELRQAKAEERTVDSIWGVEARPAAEKRMATLESRIPRLNEDFNKRYEKRVEKLKWELKKKQKEVEKLSARSTSGDRLTTAKAEEALYVKMLSALRDMEKAVAIKKRSTTGDRLSQIGLSTRDSKLREEMIKQKRITKTAYDIKDLKADIAALETRKKEDKDWGSGDERRLKMTRIQIEKTGKNIEDQVARVRMRLQQNIEKLQYEIKRFEDRIAGAKSGSKSHQRYTDEKWEIEQKLFAEQTKDAFFVTLAAWK